MAIARKVVTVYGCERCSNEWVPRRKGERPRVCPECKSPYWDRPRKGEEMSTIPLPEEANLKMLSNVFIHYKDRDDPVEWINDERCMSAVPAVGDIVYPTREVGPYRVAQVDFHPWRSPKPQDEPLAYAEDVEIWLEPAEPGEIRQTGKRYAPREGRVHGSGST